MKRIVVIGGTGHFGARICRRLVGKNGPELVITSRTLENAQSFADELRSQFPEAPVLAARLDHYSPNLVEELQALTPDVVVHTAGPYQGQSYAVAEACIAMGSHYIDLADGREFVCGFDTLHDDAIERDVLLVTGASTLPGLSSVVIDSVRDRFQAIDSIRISIAPAHQTPRGRSTISAVLSYCGRPFPVLVDGRREMLYGWQDLTCQQYPALGNRLSGACDVPDLELFPDYIAGLQTITFHAALESRREQISLWLMAWLTRAKIVRNWEKLVPAFQWIGDRLIGFGSDSGGMQISISGTGSNGVPKTLRWDLVARRNHGPEIPCTPASIVARKLIDGSVKKRGAIPCLGLFSMEDFELEVSDLDIAWTISEQDSF